MNISNDIYRISRQYILDSINRSSYPDFESICTNLKLEFGEDWKILLPKNILEEWFLNITTLSFLELSKHTEEILIHNGENIQYYEANKRKLLSSSLMDEDIDLCLKLLCLKYKVDWNISRPFVSYRANIQQQNVRISLTHSSLSSSHSHKCSIRILSTKTYPLADYFSSQSDMETILKLFRNKANIIVCGSTGSGKTSFLSSLLTEVDENQHIFIVEDTFELTSPNVTTTRLVSCELPRHSLSDYCSYALRMRPDRIVLGEIRSHEVVPLILNSNTGHKGLLTTIHANNARECTSRISTLLCLYSGISGMNNQTALDIITAGIDVIIFLENKLVTQAISLSGHERGQVNYENILITKNEELLTSFQYLR